MNKVTASGFATVGAEGATPVVTTRQGAVRGVVENGVAVFRGIPYAEAPVGRRRFTPPVRVARWEGVRDARRFGDICPQTGESPIDSASLPRGVPQGDDCLNLNVWTPAPGFASLPVFVWIHGGSFKWGAGSVGLYDGSTFARDGVVAVTLNYRLGASGFLNIGDKPGSGCFGLLDQIAALEWVQENIAAFGGDPAQVTIAGESAGGFSVGQLLAAPGARGLFRRAIAQSGGTMLQTRADAGAFVGRELLARLGTTPEDEDGLAAITSADLLAAQIATLPRVAQLLVDHGLAVDPLAFMVSPLTPNYGGDVQPTAALEAIQAGSAAGVDLIVGHTAEEASLLYPSSEAAMFARPFMEKGLDLAFSAAGCAGSEILRGYASRRTMADITEAVRPAGTDFIFRIPTIRLAEAALTHNPRVYMFSMAWGGSLGAAHGLDVPLMFDSLEPSRALIAMLGVDDARPAQPLATAMHGAWVNFVKTGSPQHPDLPEWPQYDLTRRATMELNLASCIVDDPGAEERQLWDAARY